jgi:GxxExxY protein
MPIECTITSPRLTTDEFGDLDYAVMGHAFACHKELGRLADESVYQADLARRLMEAGLLAEREVPVKISFREFSKVYYLDLVADSRGVYELKSAAKLTTAHAAQLMNYLMFIDGSRGKMINFKSSSVESKFVNVPFTLQERRKFAIHERSWSGGEVLRDCIVEMLRDWGTGLELPLYHQAIVHLLGGEALVSHQLEMRHNNAPIGFQKFHLLRSEAAFRVTCHAHLPQGYERQLRKLIQPSPLKTMHWINIGLHEVSFTSVNSS